MKARSKICRIEIMQVTGSGIQNHDSQAELFFIEVTPSLKPWSLLAFPQLGPPGDIAATPIGTLSFTINQTQSSYIHLLDN